MHYVVSSKQYFYDFLYAQHYEQLIYIASDVPGLYRVVTPQTHSLNTHLPKGCIYRINTGAPLPAGTDSVVIVEDTELVISTADGEEAEVRTLKHTSPGENVRSPGSDVRRGDLVLTKGEILHGTGGEIGTLAFVGRKEVYTYLRNKRNGSSAE